MKIKKQITLGELIIIIVSITLSICLIFFMIYNKRFYIYTKGTEIIDTYNDLLDSYYEELDEEELSGAAINGMMEYLNEKYSIYMDTDQSTDLAEQLDGSYEGIGVQVTKIKDEIVIVNVITSTPAERVGLKSNDVILFVDNESVKDKTLEEVTTMIKGKEKVSLVIKREDENLNFTVELNKIDNPVVTYKMFDNDIGYIYIESFTSSAPTQVKDALERLDNEGMKSLIIDVRSDTGGYLSSVNEILSMFLKKGKTLYIVEDNKEKKTYYDETDEERTMDIVVLIDSNTASAAEILASAMKESYGSIIIGTTSYGKGKVQQMKILSNNTSYKYTSAKWYTPNGNSIDEVGIIPGIYVPLTIEYVVNPTIQNDTQLQKALEVLNK